MFWFPLKIDENGTTFIYTVSQGHKVNKTLKGGSTGVEISGPALEETPIIHFTIFFSRVRYFLFYLRVIEDSTVSSGFKIPGFYESF